MHTSCITLDGACLASPPRMRKPDFRHSSVPSRQTARGVGVRPCAGCLKPGRRHRLPMQRPAHARQWRALSSRCDAAAVQYTAHPACHPIPWPPWDDVQEAPCRGIVAPGRRTPTTRRPAQSPPWQRAFSACGACAGAAARTTRTGQTTRTGTRSMKPSHRKASCGQTATTPAGPTAPVTATSTSKGLSTAPVHHRRLLAQVPRVQRVPFLLLLLDNLRRCPALAGPQ